MALCPILCAIELLAMSAAAASAVTPPASSSALSLCWAFDLGAFRRSGAGTGAPFEALLALVENDADERTRIMRFHFPQDRQRALLGRMAMRAALTRILSQTTNTNREVRSLKAGRSVAQLSCVAAALCVRCAAR
jgi:hypothetical protein